MFGWNFATFRAYSYIFGYTYRGLHTKGGERLFAVHGLSERTTVKTSSLLLRLFLTFSVLVANPEKLLYTAANPAPRGLLNREMYAVVRRRYR